MEVELGVRNFVDGKGVVLIVVYERVGSWRTSQVQIEIMAWV
jgi:hypothetical protein